MTPTVELNLSQNQMSEDITKKLKPEEVVTREREMVDNLYSNVKTQQADLSKAYVPKFPESLKKVNQDIPA